MTQLIASLVSIIGFNTFVILSCFGLSGVICGVGFMLGKLNRLVPISIIAVNMILAGFIYLRAIKTVDSAVSNVAGQMAEELRKAGVEEAQMIVKYMGVFIFLQVITLIGGLLFKKPKVT
ncbi:MAG: hypothetical protein NT027_18750 [Proteobacteria bacterium]|nr:hypothetical protein [Pseudomonadota bacterium]